MSDPVAAYRAVLGDPHAFEFPLHALDRLGVPVWSVATWNADGTLFAGIGYGATDADARASAWGELAESALAYAALARSAPVRGSYLDLLAEHGPRGVLDPRWAPLPAGCSWRPEGVASWLPMTAASDGREVLVPAELVATSPADLPSGDEPLFTPVTNGLGAGRDVDMARAHGVRELLQRDGNAIAYRALDQGVAVDLAGLEDVHARELLDRFDAAGLDVVVKLAGITCGVASVYCVGRERDLRDVPHPLMLAASGEAAHPRRELAVRKALQEFAAGRSRRLFSHGRFEDIARVVPDDYLRHVRGLPRGGSEKRALEATRRWAALTPEAMTNRLAPVFAVRRSVPLASLPDAGGGDPMDFGFEVLWAGFTSPDAPATAGKAFVPGLEVESLSYARVGPRNLARLRELGVAWAGIGEPPPGASPLALPEGLPAAWLNVEDMGVAVGELYALYREPDRHAIARE